MAKKELTLEERLTYRTQNAFSVFSEAEKEKAKKYCRGYTAYLNTAKTEREIALYSMGLAEKNGFVPYRFGMAFQPGDKFYYNNQGKSLILFQIGSEPLDAGVLIAAAHIDSPRLDLKPRPLYEDSELGFFKTHYYGGIKKYQWPTIPLALHGTVIRKDGSSVEISIGEKEEDPVFCITDLLPHLAQDQVVKSLSAAFTGENLNILIGSETIADADVKEKVKLNLLRILNEAFEITEEDFLSAEICAVPAFKARDVGFDRSMLGAYAHDDRVCAYPQLTALFELKNPKHTVMVILADKEETGSDGNTGMQSWVLSDLLDDLSLTAGVRSHTVRAHSMCLSADVNAAYDPNFPDVSEKNNVCYLNRGVCITKYTGSRGKYGTNDASAEFMGYVRRILNENHVVWQTGEMGKVDVGGGGTVAKYISQMNIPTVDIGVPVLCMHSPFEIVAKNDVYATHRALLAFFKQ